MQQAIEELEGALEHLETARDGDPIFEPYAENPYPRLLLGRAIQTIRNILQTLAPEKEE